VIVLGVLVVQLVAYFALARFAFCVPAWRAAGIATLRVVIGVILFFGLVLLNADKSTPVGAWLGISSPIAWGLVALLDPRRSIRRGVAWALLGTALTFGVNELYWRLVLGESLLSTDSRWSFG